MLDHDRGAAADGGWSWPVAWLLLAATLGTRLVLAVANELEASDGQVTRALFEEGTGVVAGLPVMLVLLWAIRRWPVRWPPEPRWVAWAVGGFLVVTIAHTTMLEALRGISGPMAGFPEHGWDFRVQRYVVEASVDLMHAALITATLSLVAAFITLRDRERRTQALEAVLLDAQLRGLRSRLEPHFLFNALNTIANTMREDVDAADRQLQQLSALFRAAHDTGAPPLTSIEEEVALLQHYLSLAQARFEDRLAVSVDVTPRTTGALIPSLLVQPLVENAVRHGALERDGRATIAVRIDRVESTMQCTVSDDGPGVPEGVDPMARGTGLSTTAERLRLLFGDAASLRIVNAPPGCVVTVAWPARVA